MDFELPEPTAGAVVQHYSPKLNAFFGVLINLKSKHVPRRLVRFDVTSGVCEQVCDLDWDAWDVAFLDVTDQLVTTSGEIRNLSDARLPAGSHSHKGNTLTSSARARSGCRNIRRSWTCDAPSWRELDLFMEDLLNC